MQTFFKQSHWRLKAHANVERANDDSFQAEPVHFTNASRKTPTLVRG